MWNLRSSRSGASALLLSACAALSGCGGAGDSEGVGDSADDAALAPALTATASLAPTRGNTAQGTVTFMQTEAGVQIFASLSGLEPGTHGFHIHENGDCSSPDGSSAGGHFNPGGMNHAGPDADSRHVGDLGNVVADSGGNATYERVDTHMTLDDGPNSIVGRAVVVHASADDLESQPSGAAGARIACGVITLASGP